jgi:hypothetical protein
VILQGKDMHVIWSGAGLGKKRDLLETNEEK